MGIDRMGTGKKILIFLLVWVTYALFLTSQKVAVGLEQGLSLSMGFAWVRPAVEAFWWALLTPLILRLSKLGTAVTFSWQRLGLLFLAHLALGILITYAHNQISTFTLYLFQEGRHGFNPFSRRWFAHFLRNPLPMTYLLMVGLSLIFQIRNKLQQEESARVRLAGAHARLKMAHLRQSLQPHLLFNTLHTIQIQAQDSNPQAAVTLVSRFSKYLRLVLDHREQDLISMVRELENLQAYLAIQEIRYGARLQLTRELAPHLDECLVPAFCLQTLVENAIKYGELDAPMVLKISPQGDDIVICLSNQILETHAEKPGWGLGLTVLREQLDMCFPMENELSLKSGERDVTTRVQFPLRRGPAS